VAAAWRTRVGSRSGESRERLRLGPSAHGVRSRALRPIHQQAHDEGHHDEDDQGDQVLQLGDRPRVDRWGEVPVQQERGHDRRAERRPDAAHRTDHDHEREIEEHVGGQAERVAERDQGKRQQRQSDERHRAAGELPTDRQPAEHPSPLLGAASSRRIARDHVNVDRPGLADHTIDHRAAQKLGDPGPIARSEHDLRDVLRPRDVEQGVGHGRPDHLTERAAQNAHELSRRDERGRI
jgi:hypothetical protein